MPNISIEVISESSVGLRTNPNDIKISNPLIKTKKLLNFLLLLPMYRIVLTKPTKNKIIAISGRKTILGLPLA
jgi:hypothetical protein